VRWVLGPAYQLPRLSRLNLNGDEEEKMGAPGRTRWEQLVLGAVRCQPAKMARAWCIAWLAIESGVGRGWQDIKRLLGYVRTEPEVSKSTIS
jgi:hypothetical protein